MNISYDYYKVFYYVAKYKSFTKAAKTLVNTQPNITRMIKKLEDELDCTLFIRHRYGVTLTSEGEKLYAHISIAMEHILSAEEELENDKSLKSGTISISASEIALHCFMLPILKIFRNRYQGVRIKILNQTTPEAIEAVKNGLADFAVVTEPFRLSSNLYVRPLQKIEEVPVCSKSFPFSSSEVLLKSDLETYPIIGLGEKTASFQFYSDYFSQMGLEFRPDLEASTADQILPMVKSDLGIGFVPKAFITEEDMDKLILLQVESQIPSRNICLIKRDDISLSIAASELEKMIYGETKL